MSSKQDVELPQIFSFTKTWHTAPYHAISPTLPSLSASGKNIVITGGGTGIGKAIATTFAAANASSISILGRREERLKSGVEAINAASAAADGHTRSSYEIVDLLKRDELEKAIERIVQQNGPIDVFVSNAGAFPNPAPLLSTPIDDFIHGFDMNVRTAFNAVQVFIPHAAPGAVLLNISTGVAHIAPMPGAAVYAASKAANLKMMDYVARENEGLRVVSLHPGVVDTELSAGSGVVAADDADLPGQFAVWLASSEAEFLKGKLVWANWDVEELKERAEEIRSSRLLTWSLEGVPM